MNKTTMIVIGLVLIAGSFYAGMKYGGNATVTPNNGNGNFGARIRNGNGGPDGGFVTGEIIAKDDKSITLKLRDGGSKIVFLTSATPVTKSVSGSVSDLTLSEQVSVTGTANPDGSVSA